MQKWWPVSMKDQAKEINKANNKIHLVTNREILRSVTQYLHLTQKYAQEITVGGSILEKL